MLALLWVLIVATFAAMMVVVWRFLRERLRGPRPVTILADGETVPGRGSAGGRVVEIPIDEDYARRSGAVNYARLALVCGLIVLLPGLWVCTLVSAGRPVPTWLTLTTAVAVMLAAIAVLHDLRYLAAFRRLATAAGRLGLRFSDDGLYCSIVAVGSADCAALIREGRPVRFLPWSDITRIQTQEVLEHGNATWFLAVTRRSSPTTCMIRFASLAVSHDRLVEVAREASAAGGVTKALWG